MVIGSNNPQSSWQCSIDGVTFASSPFQFWENNWWMCSTSIHDGPHTLTVNAIVADGEMFWFDRVIYTPSVSVSLSNQAMFIDNHNTQIQYGAGWRIDGGSANITNQAGTKFTYEFDGISSDQGFLIGHAILNKITQVPRYVGLAMLEVAHRQHPRRTPLTAAHQQRSSSRPRFLEGHPCSINNIFKRPTFLLDATYSMLNTLEEPQMLQG